MTGAFLPNTEPGQADDTLDLCRADAFRLLARGAADRRSPMHTPVLASVDGDGAPALRTVVLRAWDPAARVLRVHTDLRSPKVAELRARPRAALLAYDPGQRVQLRLSGTVSLHAGDAVAASAWAESRPASRTCYAAAHAPGAEVHAPAPAPTDTDAGWPNFVAICLRLEVLDYLSLAHSGHRRARFDWRDGALVGRWVAP